MVRVQLTLIAVVVILSVVAVSAFSEKLSLASPLSLVAVGTTLSFAPGMPDIHITPEWILAGVLPPLLYASAVNIPAVDFRRDRKFDQSQRPWSPTCETRRPAFDRVENRCR